jgi:hypothetical protein
MNNAIYYWEISWRAEYIFFWWIVHNLVEILGGKQQPAISFLIYYSNKTKLLIEILFSIKNVQDSAIKKFQLVTSDKYIQKVTWPKIFILLQFRASYYPFGIFKLFLTHPNHFSLIIIIILCFRSWPVSGWMKMTHPQPVVFLLKSCFKSCLNSWDYQS